MGPINLFWPEVRGERLVWSSGINIPLMIGTSPGSLLIFIKMRIKLLNRAVLDQTVRDVFPLLSPLLPSGAFFRTSITPSSPCHPLSGPGPTGNSFPERFATLNSQVNPFLASIFPSFQCVDHSWEAWGLLNGFTLKLVYTTRASSLNLNLSRDTYFKRDAHLLQGMTF